MGRAKPPRYCSECGIQLRSDQKYTCSIEHATLRGRRLRGNKVPARVQQKFDRKGERLDQPRFIDSGKPKLQKVILTDKEQLQINREIDSKYQAPCVTKHIKKGTAEFNKLAAELLQRDNVTASAGGVILTSNLRG